MSKKLMQRLFITILFLGMVFSFLWTYLGIKSRPVSPSKQEVIFNVIPEYKITSSKGLSIWPSGTVFEEGRLAYFYATEPIIEVFFQLNATGLTNSSLDGIIHTKVLLQNVNDKSQDYWSYLIKDAPLQKFYLSDGIDGSKSNNSFTSQRIQLDPHSAEQLASQIGNELLFLTGQLQLVVESDITLQGTLENEFVKKSLTQTLPIKLQQVSFSIPSPEEASLTITLTPQNDAPTGVNIWIDAIKHHILRVIATLSLGILFFSYMLIWYKPRSKAALMHHRYREWITEGSVEVNNKMKINIFDLEGLVDLAIDLDKRVIYDNKTSKYYVLTEDIVYIHDLKRNYKATEQKQQLGTLLMKCGLIQTDQLEIGLYYQNKIGSKLGESLIALGFIDETTLYSTLAAQSNLDYYEADNLIDILDEEKVKEIGINKLKAFMAIPLGNRADGKYVIACSEFAREGLLTALIDTFTSNISLVAVKPTTINNTIEAIKHREKENHLHQLNSHLSTSENNTLKERLTSSEHKELLASYYRGNLSLDLFLKAIGSIDEDTHLQLKEQDNTLHWLVNKNYLTPDYANLLKGMDKTIQLMEWKTRQLKHIPNLAQILVQANYLTPDSLDWVTRETAIEAMPAEEVLLKNYLVSNDTIKNAKLLLESLENIISRNTLET